MIRMVAARGRRLLAAVLTVAVAFALTPHVGTAQSKKEVTVKVDDGKIFVNGEEVSPDEDGRVVLKDENGEDYVVYVRRRGDGNTVWVGSDDEDGPRIFSFGRNGSGVWSMSDDDAAGNMMRRFRLRSDDDRDSDEEFNVMFDEMPRLRAEVRELQSLRERAPRMAEEAREMAARTRELAETRAQYRGRLDLMDEEMPFMGMMMQRQSEELRKLENEIRDVAADLRRAEGSQKAELERKLDQMLVEAFDLKQADAEKNAQALADRLQELRNRQAERASARQQIIENRKRQLLGERSVLDW